MKSQHHVLRVVYCIISTLACASAAQAGTRLIDPGSSMIKVQVFKSGLFSFLAHDHLVAAQGIEGRAETGDGPSVQFTLQASRLRVVDPGISDEERAEIQQAMEGKVLDVHHYPEIRFQSTSVALKGQDRWQVNGNLTLHGMTRPMSFVVEESGGRYHGKVKLRQTDFGIEPIRIAAGTVRVKDEITIEFDVALMGAN
jgi:polyisoprenoid-binding protein YceI